MNKMSSVKASWFHLKARIERRVHLAVQPIKLGGQSFSWYRVTNPEVLLEKAADNTDQPAEELDPFWAATWRAALGLDRFLQRLTIAGVRVLELGCGSGQAGVGAAAQHALVTMTDAVGLALLVARLNSEPVASRIQFRRLRWDQDRLAEPRFPIIIGSDLVYDPSLFPLLDACARNHLECGGRMYLSEPYRHTGDRFSTWIQQAGWLTHEHDVDLGDGRISIRIFECWLPES